MALNNFMNENFPNLELRPALFYNWDIGIRFQLGVDYDSDYCYENRPYLKGVYNRAITLFKTLHLQKDEIFVVANVNDFGDFAAFNRKLNIFSKYIQDKSVLNKLTHTTLPYVFPEDDEDGKYKTHRFILKCKTSEIKYIPLLKAICNQDMGIKPKIYHDVFFINIKKETIFHVYDDRGCDLLATSPESIRDIYDKYNDWILDYDRNEIDQVFI
ncbi:hypothetical protein AM499_04975 [Bacillus sp. FJAT-22090]|uniref:DUF3885 domain-containing protein n=1 Tax=Bacillus sp. FJAT-22090 TaxID=1581038 RepID=UPI0006AE7242|nr:DUF3885 domain-containing protein [Bacillus sp. FJAT-22090]ALC85240.1 hypothetical protein AM499_04975 [Bacillus sp. FJAT-22090]